MKELDRIYNEDCLVGMQRIDDASIDMILCDLPYGTTWNKWDNLISFDDLWKCYKRIITDTGVIALTASQPFTSLVVCSNIEMFKYSWIWKKENATNFANSHCQPLKITEDILVFSKAGVAPSARIKTTYNAQGITPYNKVTRRGSAGSNYCSTLKNSNYQEYTNYPNNILEFPHDAQKLHPTQKPVALFEYLIKTYTNPGQTVLDNCLGSGTTAIAAINTGRHYIGFEKDVGYFDIAQKRIAEVSA